MPEFNTSTMKSNQELAEAYANRNMGASEQWRRSMAAAFIAGTEVGRWMPIESAPKGYDHPYQDNGRPSQFVLFANNKHVGVGYVIIEDFDGEDDVRYCDEHNEYIDKPTHWQPLPPLPLPPKSITTDKK